VLRHCFLPPLPSPLRCKCNARSIVEGLVFLDNNLCTCGRKCTMGYRHTRSQQHLTHLTARHTKWAFPLCGFRALSRQLCCKLPRCATRFLLYPATVYIL
jgi:hypothetical protein